MPNYEMESKMNRYEIFKTIVRHACEVMPEIGTHEFIDDDQLVDLGANSIDRAEIINLTMESLNMQFPRVELFRATNIGELADVFHEKLQSV